MTPITDELLDTLRRIKDGEEWQWYSKTDGCWYAPETYNEPLVRCATHPIRIKSAPVPQEWAPLEAKDVPPGSVMRCKSVGWWTMVLDVENDSVCVNTRFSGNRWTWNELMKEGIEILRPGGEWEPCKKLKV